MIKYKMTTTIRANIVSIISNEYGQMLTTINNSVLQNQLILVKHENDGVSCNKCLSVFVADPNTKNTNVLNLIDKLRGTTKYGKCNTTNDCNKGEYCSGNDNIIKNTCIKLNKSALCYDSCVQIMDDINITNTLNFNVKNFINPSEQDLISVSEKIQKKINSSYNGVDCKVDDVNNVITALSKINFQQQFSTSQMAIQIQIENITGAGSFTKINMSIVSDIIMKAILSNDTSIDMITSIVSDMIKKIKSNVDKNVLSNFQYVWSKIKKFVKIGAIIFLSLIIGIVILIILRALNKKQ